MTDNLPLSIDDIRRWTEALSSCAIEGNQLAIELLELKEIDFKKFRLEILKLEENK
jgi:hypothetical protein